jgi:hypothetical protein
LRTAGGSSRDSRPTCGGAALPAGPPDRRPRAHPGAGIILINLGELYRATDPARSRHHFSEAIHCLSGTGLPTLMADALLGLGDTEESTGNVEAAQAAWRRAMTMIDKTDVSRTSMVTQRLERHH